MKELMNWMKEEESGQGLVEYALIIGLVSLAIIGGMTLFADDLNTFWDNLGNSL